MAEVQPQPNIPEYKSLEKVQNIPIVYDSLSYAHTVFSTNPYTTYLYNTSLGIGSSAYRYSKPVQARLAPLIVRADGVVLKGLDVVESRFPYPFKTSTEELIGTLKSSSDQAYNAFYSRVQAPAYGIAQNADKSLSPIVDQLELAVNKLHPSGVTPTSDANPPKSQIHRAYKLSLDLKDQLYALSSEQIKQIQQHNLVVQKATETVYKLNDSLTAFGKETSARVQSISHSIFVELEKVQTSAAGLPSHVQSSVKPLQNQLAQTLKDLQTVIQSSSSASQKATQVAAAVQNQIGPVLEAFKETAGKLTAPIRAQPTHVNGATNASS